MTRHICIWDVARPSRQEEWGAPFGYTFESREVLDCKPHLSIYEVAGSLASIPGPLHALDFVHRQIPLDCDDLFGLPQINRELLRLRPKEMSFALSANNTDHFVQTFVARYGGVLTALLIRARGSHPSSNAISFAAFRNMLANIPRTMPKLRRLSLHVKLTSTLPCPCSKTSILPEVYSNTSVCMSRCWQDLCRRAERLTCSM